MRVLFTGTQVPFEITPVLGILVGVIGAFMLCALMVLLALKVRSDRRIQRPGDLPLKKSTAPSSEDLYDADDRNPDVVPTNKGEDNFFFSRVSLKFCVTPFKIRKLAWQSITKMPIYISSKNIYLYL